MVKRRTTTSKKKVEKIDPKDRVCKKCAFAYLMQSASYNPIVAECTKTKERHVAQTPHSKDCGFKENKEKIVIYEMIFLK